MSIPRPRRLVLVLALAVAAGGTLVLGLTSPVPPEPVARFWTWSVGGDYRGRDGVRLQRGASDCGVAALMMVLEDRHRTPRLEGVRLRVLERDRGLSLLEMQSIAAEHGLRATGWRLDFEGLARAPLPAVAHYDDHYVVVDRVEPDGMVRIRDPSIGRIDLPRESFVKLWTGNVLLFVPVPPNSQR